MSRVLGRWSVKRFFAGTRPPTDDEGPTAPDGSPLDTPEKLIRHLEEINADRDRKARHRG